MGGVLGTNTWPLCFTAGLKKHLRALRPQAFSESLKLLKSSPCQAGICSGLKAALPRSDFQGSVSCDLKCKELRHKEWKAGELCMTHKVWVIINSPTLHFYLDFVLWEHIHNNVTSIAPSLKIQERIKLLVTQCPATGYDEIYAGNTLGKCISVWLNSQ